MKNKPAWIKIIICIFPLVIVFLIYELREILIYLGTFFPACPSYSFLGIYCPGCGNTRSVQHLLGGDVLGSIKYNPVPLLGIALLVMAYIEMILAVFGKPEKLIPRNKNFWVGLVSIFIIYFILRNFYLLF